MNIVREAEPWSPILVAGGGLAGVNQPQTDFMHNSLRPLDGSTRAEGVETGNVLIGTEEDLTTPCDKSGRVVLSDITDSLGGEPAVNSTPENPYRMKALDTFHPAQDTPETANPDLGCSAHYFELSGSTLGVAWYEQGLRLVDVSNAREVRQIGYYRVTGTDPATNPSSNSWDLAWYGRYVYLFDHEPRDRGAEAGVGDRRSRRGPAAQRGGAERAARPLRLGPGRRPRGRCAGLSGVQGLQGGPRRQAGAARVGLRCSGYIAVTGSRKRTVYIPTGGENKCFNG
jgi:hypothetical protein